MAEGVSGAAAVREELPGLPGHGEHFTSVGAAHLSQSVTHSIALRSRAPLFSLSDAVNKIKRSLLQFKADVALIKMFCFADGEQ